MEPRRADFVAWYLIDKEIIPTQAIRTPNSISYADLGRVHDASWLESLATLMRELLGHKKDALATRAKLFRMTEARAAALDKAALAVRETAKAADARSVAKVRQLEIDLWDGVNLHLLGEVIHAFEGAHDMDASIPRLVPIATRRLLARHSGRRQAPEGGGEAAGAATDTPTNEAKTPKGG